jgi:hypothetical protein
VRVASRIGIDRVPKDVSPPSVDSYVEASS